MNALFGPTSAVNGWPRTVHWFFVLTFSLILPFICFGVLATPGHPHGTAHFVFALPPQSDTSSEPQTSLPALRNTVLASWCGVPLEPERADAALAALASAYTDDASTPVGQSMPSTLLSMPLLLFSGTWLLHRIEMPDFAVFMPYDNVHLTDLLVPTPPPRFTI